MWWHTVTHGRGKWRGNWRMQWVASTLHTTSEHGVSSITTADSHTTAASSRLNWRPPYDLNGLVRFAEKRNLISLHVPSHLKRSLPIVQEAEWSPEPVWTCAKKHTGLLTACEQDQDGTAVPSWSCSQAVTLTGMTCAIAVCTVKNSWWWTEELSETCRVLFQK